MLTDTQKLQVAASTAGVIQIDLNAEQVTAMLDHGELPDDMAEKLEDIRIAHLSDDSEDMFLLIKITKGA